MPEKLDWALEGLVRAVLLHQPEDIYLFAAQHFEKILRSRENSGGNNKYLLNIKLIYEKCLNFYKSPLKFFLFFFIADESIYEEI